jgi:TPR repeat protein
LEQQKLEEISELLSKGSAAAARNQYIQPPGDNALEYYRKALGLGPQNEKARAGIDRVALAFLERANRALAADDFDRAETHLTTAAAIQPENQAIGLLRKQINARRAAAQRRRSSTAATTVVAPPSPLKQVSKEEQKVKQAKQDLERGIDAYYAGAYDKARRLLNILAQQGFARAQFRLGMMYYLGRGVPQNRIIATEWIRKALPDVRRQAQEGVAWAQADLGSLYEDGLIVERDTKTAVRWYTRAAEQGYAGAQTNLGVMYAKGVGVEPDIFEAIKWLERAAAQGDRVARQNLLTLRNEE